MLRGPVQYPGLSVQYRPSSLMPENETDMQALLNTAVKAARRGGDTALRYANRIHQLKVTSKAHNDFVTQVDHAAEEADYRDYPRTLSGPRLSG